MNIDNFGRREFVPLPGGGTGGEASSGGDSSGCCCCETVHTPTAVLTTGELTVDERVLCSQLGDIHDDTMNNVSVVIAFPVPANMILSKEFDSDDYVWTFDETDVTVTATYTDGTTASITSLDGTVTFKPHDNGKTTLEIEWDFVVPEQELAPPPP